MKKLISMSILILSTLLITSLVPKETSSCFSKPNFDFHKPKLENTFSESISNNYTLTMDTMEKGWFYKPRKDGKTPEEPQIVIDLLNEYSGYYVGDTTKKYLYLTFDEGYENGYTPSILDVLKKNNVPAAFFVVRPYILANKGIIKRMADEGHLVCNHSTHHPSMAKINDQSKFNDELIGVEEAFKEVTGRDMPKYFRPPMGKYSERSLHYTKEFNYKTIFWSFAYYDWDLKKQPTQESAKKIIMQRTHDGAIILLHAVSKTNSDLMEELIKEWKASGYEFRTLDELP